MSPGLDELKATHLSLLAAISTLREKVEKVRDDHTQLDVIKGIVIQLRGDVGSF